MSHVVCTQYKQHKQAMKVRWSECKVQLKQKDNNCFCLFIIHSESEDASRIYFGITFTVIAVVLLTIAIVTVAMVVVAFICKRFVPLRSSILTLFIQLHMYIGRVKDGVLYMYIEQYIPYSLKKFVQVNSNPGEFPPFDSNIHNV